jgi:NADPH-dependent curcumin reductase CurA
MVLDAVLPRMNAFGRIAVCGMIAGYDGAPLPLSYPALILTQRLKVQGFIVSEHMEIWPEASDRTGHAGGHRQAARARVALPHGLAAAPEAFLGLLKGKNFGKQLVKLF